MGSMPSVNVTKRIGRIADCKEVGIWDVQGRIRSVRPIRKAERAIGVAVLLSRSRRHTDLELSVDTYHTLRGTIRDDRFGQNGLHQLRIGALTCAVQLGKVGINTTLKFLRWTHDEAGTDFAPTSRADHMFQHTVFISLSST